MTTKNSPLRVLKAQADRVARLLAAAERGERIEGQFAEKIAAARDNETVTFAIVMDDKILKIEIPWATIRSSGEVALAEYILGQMRETRETAH